MKLDRLVIFAAVADTTSFTSAAKRLDVPKSTVSREVAKLEEELGARLFHRTTRRVVLTAAGTALHERVTPLLAGLRSALEPPDAGDGPTGTLRVTAPADVGSTLLVGVVATFSVLYPAVKVDVHITNDVVDLVRDGFDCALRISGKALPAGNDLAARRLGGIELVLYASPRYLARTTAPHTVADLAAHSVIAFGAPGHEEIGTPKIRTNDMYFARSAARAGLGIGLLPTFLAEPDLASGDLVRVLPDYVQWRGTLWFVTPHRKQPPTRVRAFRDLLVEALARSLG